MSWSPDYKAEFERRVELINRVGSDRMLIEAANKFYATDPIAFVEDCCVTVDPRQELKLMPFLLFPKQKEFLICLNECLRDKEGLLAEKCRDMGATWECCAFGVWLWKYVKDSSIGYGSSKEIKVDKIGDMDSIFEKIRTIIRYLPWWVVPQDFNPRLNLSYMKITNPENGAIIKGEAGDNIGRGGRSLIYFKDEALTLLSNVLTLNGWKPMGQLTKMDKVIGLDGKKKSITHINDCGSFDTYAVGFSDGTTIKCSPNHLWTLNKVWGKKESVTIRTHELFDAYKFTSPGGQTQYRFRLPIIKPVVFKKTTLPLHPYVVGALLGDGGVSQVPNHSPKLTSTDAELVDYFTACLPDYCTIKPDGKYGYRLGDISGRMGWKHKSRIRQTIVEIGIAGKRSWEKSIPNAYKFSSVADRIELLQGMMDTDGSASKGGGSASYYTSSKQLAKDVRFLAESLGGYATMQIKKDKRGYRDKYALFIVLPEHIPPFRLKRKLDIYAKRKNSIERSIVSVVKTGKTESVRCITVDSKDGLYLTEGCIPTHNSAHYERPEKIEASLSMNTDVQVDISSVNGSGNVFYRRRMAGEVWNPGAIIPKGKTRIFIFDWRDDPRKSQEWYDTKRAKFEAEGLLHIFAQEVDRDYTGSIDRAIIKSDWARACIDSHLKLGIKPNGRKYAAQDVADGGADKNALAMRHGILLESVEHWTGEAQEAAKRTLPLAIEYGIETLFYDCIGVGAGFKAQTNIMKENKSIPANMAIIPWDASAPPSDAERNIIPSDRHSPTNGDHFLNRKSQGWWELRTRIYKTFRAVQHGEKYPADELVSFSSKIPMLHQLITELSQPTYSYNQAGKVIVDKKPEGMLSPNLADAVMMCYSPTPPRNSLFSF